MKRVSYVLAFALAVTVSGQTFGQGSDECTTAEPVVIALDTTIAVPVDNTLATTGVEPWDNTTCGVNAGDSLNDVWYQFVAPVASGQITEIEINSCFPGATPFDTDIGIYLGDTTTCGAAATFTLEGCNGDAPACAAADFGSTAFANLVGGTTYLVRVGGWDAASLGAGNIDFTHRGSLPVQNLVCTDNGTTADATADLQDNGLGSYDEVRVYVDGVLQAGLTQVGVAAPGPVTFTGIVVPTGGAVVAIETVTLGSVSRQVACGVFIPEPCPASAEPPMSPTALLAPFVGNINCGNAAGSAANSYFRAYDLGNQYGVDDDIQLTCFSVLLDLADSVSGQLPIRIRLHADTTGGAPDDPANFVLFYEEEFLVPDLADEFYNFVFGTGTIDPDALGLNPTTQIGCLSNFAAGSTLVVEMMNFDSAGMGDFFFTASSDASVATGNPNLDETYIFAPACGLAVPTSFAGIGFPNTLIPMDLTFDVITPDICGGVGGVANLVCTQVPGTTDFDVTWTDAGGTTSFDILVDGILQATVPAATLSTSVPSLVAYATSTITIEAFAGATLINARSCNVLVSPENNWLAGAAVATVGTVPLEITPAVTVQGLELDPLVCDMDNGGLIGGDDQLWNDLYYTFTPSVTGEVLVSTCSGATGDTRIAIYTGVSNDPADVIACNDDRIIGALTPGGTADNVFNPACTNFASELTFDATMGTQVTIRIGTFNAAGLVPMGELTVNDCVPVQNLAYTMDCTNGDVTLTWDDNPAATSISISRDGVVIGNPALGTTTFTDFAVADGDHTYEVTIDCGSGANTASIPVSVLTYTGYTDLVFSMEGLQSAPLGDRGDIDSGQEMLNSLLNNSRNAGMVRSSFADYPCMDMVENVYVHLGTNHGAVVVAAGILGPDIVTIGPAYILSLAEGDQLGTMGNNGTNIYLEGGDHWAYDHQFTLFDQRDGIDDTTLAGPGFVAAFDGDDTLTGIDGLDGGFGLDLSGLQDMVYTQDSAVNDDFTDQLTVATADAFGPNAAVIATIDDAVVVAPALPYDVMIHYDTNSGGKTVSSSFEFGGIAQSTERDAVAAAILGAFSTTPPGVTFTRGDINDDGGVNIADAIFGLGILFPQPGSPPNVANCQASADANDDGAVNIADMISLLGVLFPQPGTMPSIPAPTLCGVDPTPDMLTCDTTNNCP